MGNGGLSDLFDDAEFDDASFAGAASPENLFSILESFEDAAAVATKGDVVALQFSPSFDQPLVRPKEKVIRRHEVTTDVEEDDEGSVSRKKIKLSEISLDGQQRMSHITVERNRRKQMNEHLCVLRSLMPCFYVKRGDQASIIGGVVDYIKELQQVLHSLEAKKQRKIYSEVLSPRPASSPRPPTPSPRPSPLSPRPPPLSPIMSLPVSPRTPQPGSPYGRAINLPVTMSFPTATINGAPPSHESSPISFESSSGELVANSKSATAAVEVKFAGPNVLLKTISHRIPGQALKIITCLEGLALEILHASISTIDDTMQNSFTIKIGIECELSAEDLAHEVQQTFS